VGSENPCPECSSGGGTSCPGNHMCP
jgi:hypothetical protein